MILVILVPNQYIHQLQFFSRLLQFRLKMNTDHQQEIETYYQECNRDYQIVWQLNHSLALHYGYWDENTLTHRQALWNTNFQIARHAQISASDYVFDAGCGVGGTSLFLANTIGCRVQGISLSSTQVAQARRYKARLDEKNRTEFTCQSYYNTHFPDNTFDVVIALESAVHSEPKMKFVKEAFRVLKPGGRLIVADYILRPLKDATEREIVRKWGESWAIRDFIYEADFRNDLINAGFTNILQEDLSDKVFPSIKLMHRSYYPGIFISRISNFFGRRTTAQVGNSKSGLYQFQAFKLGVWRYKHFLAIKPPVEASFSSFSDYIRHEPRVVPYIDTKKFSDRFQILSRQGFSGRNIFKRLMHFYLETNIRKKEKWF